MMIDEIPPLCAHGTLNWPSDLQRQWNEVKEETPFRYADAEIRTEVVVICGPTRYQLDHGGVYSLFSVYIKDYNKCEAVINTLRQHPLIHVWRNVKMTHILGKLH